MKFLLIKHTLLNYEVLTRITALAVHKLIKNKLKFCDNIGLMTVSSCFLSFTMLQTRALFRDVISSNSNSTTFELRKFSPDSKFDECFKRFVVECEFVDKSLFYE